MNRVVMRRVTSNIHVSRFTWRAFSTELPGPQINQAKEGLVDKNIPQYDIAIVGGGMVGMALACSLASLPLTKQLKIAIIDSNPSLKSGITINKEDSPDPRVSTVTPATISLYQGIGAWKYVQQYRHAYFDKMQVWDHTGLGYTRYNAKDINKETLGCVVENKVLHKSLYSCLQDTNLDKTIHLARLNSLTIDRKSSFAKLGLSDGNSLYAKLVVGSDGSKSHVRELTGIKTTDWKYPQNAIICTVEHTGENYCAWQRFLPNGPIALLPIGKNYSNIVWSMSPEEAVNRKSMNSDDFVREINYALDNGYGPYPRSLDILSWVNELFPLSAKSANERFEIPNKILKVVSEKMVFPLSLRHAKSYVSKRVVLIGDAAHTVHPLAGQGVNMGFADVNSLSKVISEGVAVGSDIGEVSLLRRYELERKSANVAMMAILDGIQKGYSVDYMPMKLLRGAAFHGANYFSPLKKQIVSYASGEKNLPVFLW